MRILIGLAAAAYSFSTLAAVSLYERTQINLLKGSTQVDTLTSWEGCLTKARELAKAATSTSGSVTYTCQTERRQVIATYSTNPPTPPVDPPPTPGTALCAGLPSLTTVAKPMPAIAKPAKLTPFTDPVSGAKVVRITDVAADFPGQKVLKPAYSTVPAWNADESYLILYRSGGGHFLYNGKTYAYIKQLDIQPADIEHFYWSSTDPDVLFYPYAWEASSTSVRQIIKFHVSTGQKEVLYAIPNAGAPSAYRVDFGGDPIYGDWSNAVFGLRRRGSTDTGFIWSAATGESPRVAGGAPQVSPSGTLYIQNGGLYGLNAVMVRTMKSDTNEHGDMTKLANGQDVWISSQYDHAPNGNAIMENLATGVVTTVIGEANGYGYPPTGTHLSGHAFKAPGWTGISITGVTTGKALLSQSVLLVDLNTGKGCYAAHHHSAGSDGPNGYWAEPHVNISPSGTRLMFGSDWGGGSTVDTYIVETPSYRP